MGVSLAQSGPDHGLRSHLPVTLLVVMGPQPIDNRRIRCSLPPHAICLLRELPGVQRAGKAVVAKDLGGNRDTDAVDEYEGG